jgi:hypothetical protein
MKVIKLLYAAWSVQFSEDGERDTVFSVYTVPGYTGIIHISPYTGRLSDAIARKRQSLAPDRPYRFASSV